MNNNTAYLLIGGNMGNREALLAAARQALQQRCGTIVMQSSVYQTAAWGLEDQSPFLNQALALQTALLPAELLQTILSIEEGLGRKRSLKYGPRLIDIDILLYNDVVVNEAGLQIPHPQLQNRRFVLVPLAEIAASVVHPVLGQTVAHLLASCPDPLAVQKF